MRFTERRWLLLIGGLAWLCVSPMSACDEKPANDDEHADEGSGSSSSSSSSWGGSGHSWRPHSGGQGSVSDCKQGCNDDGDDCKHACDEDDEDCNQGCDDDRYACRRGCERDNDCDNSCDAGCESECGDDLCQKTCSDSCKKQCGSDSACQSSCGSDCDDSCKSDCKKTCGDSCKKQCGSDSDCRAGCDSACDQSCGGLSCQRACGDSCKKECGSDRDCRARCDGACDQSCGGLSCQQACSDACRKECGDDRDCKAGCDGDCDHSCKSDCKKTCGDSCKKQCGSDGDCKAGCDDACDHSCSDGSSGGNSGGGAALMPVTIQFAARVGDADFSCGQQYAKQGTSDTTVTATDMRMFVHNVKLITSGGKEVALKLAVRAPWQSEDLALLDFEDGAGECGEGNQETNTTITGSIPRDRYVGVSFSNGVPEAINHADPTTLSDPLKTFANLSWGWLGGFRFTKVELKQVTQPGEVFGNALLHIGSTACSGNAQAGTVMCAKPNRNHVVLDKFDPKSSTIVFDIEPVFAQTDLTTMAECHSTGEYCEPMFKAFGVDFATGKALGSQSVFRVE